MMRVLIVYYSRTGTTKAAAEQLAGLLGADIAEIRCDRYGPGVIRYFRAAYDSVKERLPPIEVPPALRGGYDMLILATPIWTSHPALPMRALLASGITLPKRVALLVTRIGAPPERAFAEMEAQLPAPAEARLALTSSDVRQNRVSSALRDFAARINRHGAA